MKVRVSAIRPDYATSVVGAFMIFFAFTMTDRTQRDLKESSAALNNAEMIFALHDQEAEFTDRLFAIESQVKILSDSSNSSVPHYKASIQEQVTASTSLYNASVLAKTHLIEAMAYLDYLKYLSSTLPVGDGAANLITTFYSDMGDLNAAQAAYGGSGSGPVYFGPLIPVEISKELSTSISTADSALTEDIHKIESTLLSSLHQWKDTTQQAARRWKWGSIVLYITGGVILLALGFLKPTL